jgi:hypothetical protein
VRWPHVEQSAPNERFPVHAEVLPHRSIGETALEVRDMPIGDSEPSNDREGVKGRLECFNLARAG